MDSWEFTKIAAAVLAALLITVGSKTAIEISEAAHGPKIVGYKLPVKEGTAATAGAAKAEEGMAFAKVAGLMEKASAEAGQGLFKQCQQCHTPGKGGPNSQGPNLWGIVERTKASVAGFNYSDAAKSKAGEKWTYQNLVAFLHNPKGYMPGTKMAYKGIAEPAEMADMIAYLRTLADAPVPMPK